MSHGVTVSSPILTSINFQKKLGTENTHPMVKALETPIKKEIKNFGVEKVKKQITRIPKIPAVEKIINQNEKYKKIRNFLAMDYTLN